MKSSHLCQAFLKRNPSILSAAAHPIIFMSGSGEESKSFLGAYNISITQAIFDSESSFADCFIKHPERERLIKAEASVKEGKVGRGGQGRPVGLGQASSEPTEP